MASKGWGELSFDRSGAHDNLRDFTRNSENLRSTRKRRPNVCRLVYVSEINCLMSIEPIWSAFKSHWSGDNTFRAPFALPSLPYRRRSYATFKTLRLRFVSKIFDCMLSKRTFQGQFRRQFSHPRFQIHCVWHE